MAPDVAGLNKRQGSDAEGADHLRMHRSLVRRGNV